MKTYIVSKLDLDKYFLSSRGRTKIEKIRRKIVSNMPYKLRVEFKTRYNDLVKVDSIRGIYKFVARDCSPELRDHLASFKLVIKR